MHKFSLFLLPLFFSACSDSLTVNTEPPYANVRVNGEEAGISPVDVKVNRRKPIAVFVEKDGYVSKEQIFEPKAMTSWGKYDPELRRFNDKSVTIQMERLKAYKRPAAPARPPLRPIPSGME